MKLERNELHIWHIRPAEMEGVALADIPHISSQELLRARRYKKPQHGLWWAFVRSAMRNILSEYLAIDPESIRFDQQLNVKPKLIGTHQTNIEFNLSHTKEYALLAIHAFIPVGVDVEALAEISDMQSVVQRFFSLAEQEPLYREPISRQLQSFYQIWTRKEALIKANGLGLSAPLQDFDVPVGELSLWDSAVLRADLLLLGQHVLVDLSLSSGFIGAVCLHLGSQEHAKLPELRHFTYAQADD